MATAVVTLEEARKAVAAESRKRNFKIVEQIPGIISGLAKEKAKIYFPQEYLAYKQAQAIPAGK